MMEGLPPNNATHLLRITLDEVRARAVADILVESFEATEVAAAAFETEDPWPEGGKACLENWLDREMRKSLRHSCMSL